MRNPLLREREREALCHREESPPVMERGVSPAVCARECSIPDRGVLPPLPESEAPSPREESLSVHE